MSESATEIQSVKVDGLEYLSVKDFAKLVNRSYTTIYMLAKYGFTDGSPPLESIYWNSRLLILLSEKTRINSIKPIGRPRKGET